jgi:hypothetical protein
VIDRDSVRLIHAAAGADHAIAVIRRNAVAADPQERSVFRDPFHRILIVIGGEDIAGRVNGAVLRGKVRLDRVDDAIAANAEQPAQPDIDDVEIAASSVVSE